MEHLTNKIIVSSVIMENESKIKEQYELMEHILDHTKYKKEIEMLKIPTYIELAKKYISENKAIVIFVNYFQTAIELADKLNTKSIIYSLDEYDTQKIIHDFNNDAEHIIICTYQMAIVGGIMFNDTHGNYPRVSIMSNPVPDPDRNIPQILGRIVRRGTKTSTMQEIFYCANIPTENKLCEKARIQCENII